MKKLKWSEKTTIEEVLKRVGQKRTVLNNTRWFGLILRQNCLCHDAIEGQITEVKGAGRRRTQFLDDLRNRRRYWEVKEEAEERKR